MCYSALTFAMKVATAFASMGLGVILDAYGFEAGNVTATAISGIRLWYGILPIALGAVALIAASFFNVDRSMLDRVHKELAVRHGEAGN